MDSLRDAVLVWAFDAGRSQTRLAYAALWALGGNTDARTAHSLGLLISGFGMNLFVRSFDDRGGVCGFARRRWSWKGGCGYWLYLSVCCEWG
jgi:hypothetical protein